MKIIKLITLIIILSIVTNVISKRIKGDDNSNEKKAKNAADKAKCKSAKIDDLKDSYYRQQSMLENNNKKLSKIENSNENDNNDEKKIKKINKSSRLINNEIKFLKKCLKYKGIDVNDLD